MENYITNKICISDRRDLVSLSREIEYFPPSTCPSSPGTVLMQKNHKTMDDILPSLKLSSKGEGKNSSQLTHSRRYTIMCYMASQIPNN